MKNVVTFTLASKNCEISIEKKHSTKVLSNVDNASAIYCAHNYAKIGDVVIFAVANASQKAADAFFSAIHQLEKNFKVNAEIINGQYIAAILGANLKAA